MSDPIMYDMEDALSAMDSVEPSGDPKPAEGAPAAAPQDDPRIEAMREALRISEGARADLMARIGQPQVTQPAQPSGPRWFSREEIREMLNSEDPDVRFQAVEISQNQAIAQAAQHFEHRLGTLTNGTFDAAKAEAKRLFPIEFELFGDQIEAYANNLPDKSQLSNTTGWSHIVRFVRGEDANFDKLADARASRKARETQQNTTPNTFTPTRSAPSNFVLDDATREIALNLVNAGIYKSVDEYVKDMKGLTNLAM